MRIATIKACSIMLISLSLCACNGHRIDKTIQENQNMITDSSPEIFSGEELPKEEKQLRFDGSADSSFQHLNNKAILFGDYLYIKSMYADYIFSGKDEHGNYHLWESPKDLFTGITKVHYVIKHNNQLICISENEKGNNEIIIYNSEFKIQNRKEINLISPEYIYANVLYGYTISSGYRTLTAIKLDSLEEKDIYSCESDKLFRFIINENGEVIISENLDRAITRYFKYEEKTLFPIIETKPSIPVLYDSRGLFYLEESDSASQMNLMLWDGKSNQKVGNVKTDDMNEWSFSNGIFGNIVIDDKYFVSIHINTDVPYLLIQQFDSGENKRIPLEKWTFTEADMERYGETFSGVYYESGQIINYFFSNKKGTLQTQILDIKQ
ncbi:hypothetical protein ABFV83_12355 [Lacrimispora sp. BS-2]|uniref:Lipoprotein n=1 Tax=Lacrimispora sp. BS-2 TaxID=3151850 RepID=A0AAU7PK39_9FIRM